MPPKAKITKDMIVAAAIEIIKEEGFENVNARSVTKRLNCSTRPIFTCYENMEFLKKDIYTRISGNLIYDICSKSEDKDFLSFIIQYFFDLARNDKNIFKYVFLSGNFDGETLSELLDNYKSNQIIVEKICSEYAVDREKAEKLFYKTWFFVFGIAVMIATNSVKLEMNGINQLTKEFLDTLYTGDMIK